MRENATRLNRPWLGVIGLLLLLGGLVVVAIGTGVLGSVPGVSGLGLTAPARSARLFGTAAGATLGLTWVVVVLAAAGVLLAVLAIGWLVAQVPRTNQAKPFRLHDSASDGLTRCAPGVLTNAVEAQLEALPDVGDASAVLRGSAREPDLTVRVTASDRADVRQLLQVIQTQVAGDLETSLDTRLRRLGVQVEIDTTRTRSSQITLRPERVAGTR